MSNQQFEFADPYSLVLDCSPYKRHPFCTSRYRRTIPSLYILTAKFSIDSMRFHQRFDGNSRRNQRGASNNGHAPNQVYLGASRIAGVRNYAAQYKSAHLLPFTDARIPESKQG